MKRIILSLVSLFFAFNLFAQEELRRNKFIIGGNIHFAKQNNQIPNSYGGYIYPNREEFIYTSLFLNSYIGRELNENLLFGFQVNYDKIKREYVDASANLSGIPDIESKQYGIGIFSRYVFNPQNKVKFLLQAGLGYNAVDKVQENGFFSENNSEKSIYLDATLKGGLLVNITKRFHLIGSFGRLFYQGGEREVITEDTFTGLTETEKSKFSTFGTSINTSTIYFGIEFQF